MVKEADIDDAARDVSRVFSYMRERFDAFRYAAFNDILAQRDNALLFIPVLLAFGIGVYFSLSFEPHWLIAPFIFVLLLSSLAFVPRGGRYLIIGLMLVVMGFCAAQIRTISVHTPMLSKEMKFANIEGRVQEIEPLDKGVRVLLGDVEIEELSADQTPRKTRVKVWDSDGLAVGQRVQALAGLNTPSYPVIPGGFNFRRYMYFHGIGASGFTYKTPEVVEGVGGWRLGQGIEHLRDVIGTRIQENLSPDLAGLALALMVGQKRAIGEDDLESVRASGLAHMLAISGLHIGLFSGVIFFAVRSLMACFPVCALRYPIKKYAAGVAIIGAFFYMLLAGSTIPSERAMITVAVIFSAVMLDRSAISLRVVAFAAFLILLFFPESLLSVSFQMSFAAVTCLVAFYDWLRPVWSSWHRRAGVLRRASLYFLGVSMTTVVATFATAPFTLFHFQNLAVYGILANFICVPILAFVIMPCALLALLLMPFGLDGWAFWVMQPALQIMLDIARDVSALDGSVFRVAQWSFASLVFVVIGTLSIILLRARLRVIAVCACVFLVLLNFQTKQYDVLVSSEFDLVAMRSFEPFLFVSSRRANAFSRENWESSLGFEQDSSKILPREGEIIAADFVLRCGGVACRYERLGQRISYLKDNNAAAFQEECAWADVVLMHEDFGDCDHARVITKWDVYKHGAHTLTLSRNSISIERTQDFLGARPWNR